MPADVLFTPFESHGKLDSLNLRIAGMVERTGFLDALPAGARVALKVHPGERNNLTYLRPSLARSLSGLLGGRGAAPFVTETTTLYCRERFTAEELVATAAFNGFSEETMGCPFVVADSQPDVVVKVDGERLGEVGVAGRIAAADALLVLTHVTCHDWTAGLAASLKQLGMGCTGRKSKAEIHLSTAMSIDPGLCVTCGTCADTCKSGAVRMEDDQAVLTELCARCGVCIGFCPEGAIGYSHDFGWFAEGLAEASAGVLSLFGPGRTLFVNCLIDVTRHCDCEDFSAAPIFDDIGVVVSTDPVAADRASGDLLNSAVPLPGTSADTPGIRRAADKIFALTGIEWWKQLDHGQAMGIGTTDYRLTRMD